LKPAIYPSHKRAGSTACPKPVPLRHGPLVRNDREIARRQHLPSGDRLWMAAPFFFGYGCANALPVALTHAATLCLQERVVGDEALAFIERERCTVYCGLATTTRTLLAAPTFGERDISSLRTGTTGFTAGDKRLAIEELGVAEVCSVYGLTEAYGHATMTDALDPVEVKLHTQGTVVPTQELRIVDEQGRPCGSERPATCPTPPPQIISGPSSSSTRRAGGAARRCTGWRGSPRR
jgi:acyl-CoA synthetase (AMP-forming)/AMP-acid ligase II